MLHIYLILLYILVAPLDLHPTDLGACGDPGVEDEGPSDERES